MAAVERMLQKDLTLPFPSGSKLKVSYGPLSSGEGLIHAIRDKNEDDEDDKGVVDKRIVCIESELGAALRAFQRQGNNLSSVLRQAWDGLTLAPMTKHNREQATDPHICLLAHITLQELNQLLSAVDIWNGFANRFLWFAVRRSKIVPFPKPMSDADVERIAQEIARVIKHAHKTRADERRLVLSNSAHENWAHYYNELNTEHPGMLGAVTSRGAAQTLRLAMTYAQLAGADRIEAGHLEAAMTLWRYSFDSAAYIFGGKELDPIAQTILEALATGPKTQSELRDLFSRHVPADQLARVLDDLQERGRITLTKEQTGGCPRKVWRLAT